MTVMSVMTVGDYTVVVAPKHPLVAWEVTLSATRDRGRTYPFCRGGRSHVEAWLKLALDLGVTPTPVPETISALDRVGGES